MSITSAKHYHDELKKWQESINFFINTALELEQHLDDVVKRNSIVDIAAKVEVHQLMLNNIVDKLHYLQKEILLQISFLLKDEKLRYVPIFIKKPPPQNPDYSYATRVKPVLDGIPDLKL